MIPRIKTGTGRQFQQIYFVQTYVAGDSRILGCGPHIRYVLQHGWLEMGQLGPSACVLFAIRIFFLTLPSRHSRWPLRYILSVLIGLLAWTEDGEGGGFKARQDSLDTRSHPDGLPIRAPITTFSLSVHVIVTVDFKIRLERRRRGSLMWNRPTRESYHGR